MPKRAVGVADNKPAAVVLPWKKAVMPASSFGLGAGAAHIFSHCVVTGKPVRQKLHATGRAQAILDHYDRLYLLGSLRNRKSLQGHYM